MSGVWRFYGESGDVTEAHPIAITLDGVEVGRITAIGQEITLATAYQRNQELTARRVNGPADAAVVGMEWIGAYVGNGDPPRITARDEMLIVTYHDSWSAPRQGVVTAEARVMDENGDVLVTVDPLTLIVAGDEDGGGS